MCCTYVHLYVYGWQSGLCPLIGRDERGRKEFARANSSNSDGFPQMKLSFLSREENGRKGMSSIHGGQPAWHDNRSVWWPHFCSCQAQNLCVLIELLSSRFVLDKNRLWGKYLGFNSAIMYVYSKANFVHITCLAGYVLVTLYGEIAV